ncbi:MAG: SPOR domain-containing protein [Candidatus Omnitrophota bacterium]
MQKIKFILVFWFFLILPNFCWALDMDSLKADFLEGNYRRVIFEGQAQIDRVHLRNADELNYILGLSYLKESKIGLAQGCFQRILNNPGSKFKEEARLGLGDTYLVTGQFQQAQDIYDRLMAEDPNSRQKSAVLYRLSQLEFKKGFHQKGNEYWSKLKKDFPLSPELRSTKGIASINIPANDADGYSMQLGFFTNSANADKLKDILLSKNYPAYVESFGSGYRVKVGRFKVQQEALDLERKLSQDGFQTKICP